MTLTTREHFLIKLFTVRPSRGDAIIVLCGEDCQPRLHRGLELFLDLNLRAQTIVVSGGKDDRWRWIGANDAAGWLESRVPRDQIVIENSSMNTAEQAHNVALLAIEHDWRRLLLVASSYHLPRAMCTFDRALAGSDIKVIPAPAFAPWDERPIGVTLTRRELLDIDTGKCAQYTDDVASWEQGLKALEGL